MSFNQNMNVHVKNGLIVKLIELELSAAISHDKEGYVVCLQVCIDWKLINQGSLTNERQQQQLTNASVVDTKLHWACRIFVADFIAMVTPMWYTRTLNT